MTVEELYIANGDWSTGTKLIVLGLKKGVLYEGIFIKMPDEIVESQVLAFNSRMIIIR